MLWESQPASGGTAEGHENLMPERSPTTTQNEETTYSYTRRFLTWRKHVRDLYQRLVHIDLVWESPAVQLMPYATARAGLLTHTILSCTRTGGQEQAFVQLLSVTTPHSLQFIRDVDTTYCEATGEIGGYGMAPSQTGMRIERRILHDGDPLTVRYMHANPLLIASGSSDGNAYVFDWSRISLNKFPNEPPRPRAPLPPNEPSINATEEERDDYKRRMRALGAIAKDQERWDLRRGAGQHLLALTGSNGSCETLDWSTSEDGTIVAGSLGRVCYWQVANMSKDDPKTVPCTRAYNIDDNNSRVSEVDFSWTEQNSFVVSVESGCVLHGDIRTPELTPLVTLERAATSASISPLDGTSLLLGTSDGEVCYYDLRRINQPVSQVTLHGGPVSSVQWCPHSRHLFCSGGGGNDAMCCVFNATTSRLLFKHAGHTDNVTDVSWDWQEGCEGQLVSVDTNSITLWRPRDLFFVL
uniref:Predicted WD40 repeat protein n=1 Tax=Trypanosoma congolense (strain IL3000) TaxID=1068625 RepID=G0V0C6_TRYCI|nr:predicted WD40 repeat protein [Trypanosoma congolense IL3000]